MPNAMIFDLTFVGRSVLLNAFSRVRHFRIVLNTSDEYLNMVIRDSPLQWNVQAVRRW